MKDGKRDTSPHRRLAGALASMAALSRLVGDLGDVPPEIRRAIDRQYAGAIRDTAKAAQDLASPDKDEKE